MPEIRQQKSDKDGGVDLAEVHIPDDTDLGTGSFTVIYGRKALKRDDVATASMAKPPDFQITVSVNRNGDVPVALGKADANGPSSLVVFRLPSYINDASHTIRVEFARWHVVSATFDGAQMAERASPTKH